jgi:hypothetical protein
MIEDSSSVKHIRGDLYISSGDDRPDVCIGYFNPLYQVNEHTPPRYLLRLEDDFQFIAQRENRYESIFNKKAVPLAEYDCPVGLQELLSDLEIITYLYEFMHGIRPHNDFTSIGMTGVINGAEDTPLIKVIQIKDPAIHTTKQIVDFIDQKVDSIQLNSAYPVRIFRDTGDFTIYNRRA